VPASGSGEVLVKIRACGVRHTDLHAAKCDWPDKPSVPFIPGYEGAGTVVARSVGVTNVKEDDRIGIT